MKNKKGVALRAENYRGKTLGWMVRILRRERVLSQSGLGQRMRSAQAPGVGLRSVALGARSVSVWSLALNATRNTAVGLGT